MGLRITLNDGSGFYSDNPHRDLMDRLIEKTLTAGHMLSFDEASDDPKMVKPNHYAFYYGSFNEASQAAWAKVKAIKAGKDQVEPKRVPKPQRPIEREFPITQNPIEKKAPLSEPKRRRGRKSSHYTPEIVKAHLLAFYDRFGRLPTQTEVMTDPEMPSWVTLTKLLGPKSGWEQLLPPTPNKEEKHINPPTEQSDDSLPSQDDDQSPTVEEQEPITSEVKENEVTIDATKYQGNGAIVVEVKISLPDREKPILITLTV